MTDRAVALVHATTGATEGPKLAAKLLRSSGFRVHTKPRKATPYQVVLTDQPPAFLDRKAFLAAFGMLQDTGPVIGPILVGWFADAAGLGASAIVLAAVMFVAIAWIVVVVGETSAAAARGRRGLIHPRPLR